MSALEYSYGHAYLIQETKNALIFLLSSIKPTGMPLDPGTVITPLFIVQMKTVGGQSLKYDHHTLVPGSKTKRVQTSLSGAVPNH